MPGLTGLEVARKIRETDRNCAILFLTGFDKFDYARQAISVRAMDYLLKPYNEQELVFAVEDAIRQVSVPLSARPAQPPAPEQPVRREEDEDMRTAIIRAEISRFINAHYREDISMQDAAAALRYSDAYFCKLFKQCFKVNFSAYLNEYRVNKARQLILDPRLSLKDIGAAVGYSDANYFTRVFKRLTGQTPSEYRVAAAEKRHKDKSHYRKHPFFPACEQERNGCFFVFASFFRPKNTKIVLGYNKDKIVLRFTK